MRYEEIISAMEDEESINKAELYEKVFMKFGSTTQIIMTFEEMSELQKELCKYLRGKYKKTNIAEEIADVYIMLEQMEQYFEIETLVDSYKKYKIERLSRRL